MSAPVRAALHLLAWVACGSLLFAGPAHGQSSTSGALQGVVREQATGEPIAGVTVVAASPSLQREQAAMTDAAGAFKISNLPPGVYVVTYYYSDLIARRTEVQVSVNRATPAYVQLDTSQVAGEVIEITASAPAIDPTSTTQGVTLDQDYLRNIPMPGRTFESALDAAPGAANDGLGVSFSGSSSLENQYVVDGANTTGLTYGTVGSPLSNEFIAELEIITGGYNAEYGRATGAVVNVVTKSGSNELHGSVFSYVTPGALYADRTITPTDVSALDGESNVAYLADVGAELGGPILEDKLWFYVGFVPSVAVMNVDRIIRSRTDCRIVLGDGSLSDCRPETPANGGYRDGFPDRDPDSGFFITELVESQRLREESRSYLWFSKLSFAVSPEHQGSLSMTGTAQDREIIGVFGAPGATRFDIESLSTDVAGKWSSKLNDNNTELEALIGWHRSSAVGNSLDDSVNDQPQLTLRYGTLGNWAGLGFESQAVATACADGGPSDRYPNILNCPDAGRGYRIGGPGGVLDDVESRLSAKLSATQRLRALGGHELKAGIDVEDNRLDRLRAYSGGALYDQVVDNPFGEVEVVRVDRWVQLAPAAATDPRFDNNCASLEEAASAAAALPCDFINGQEVAGNTVNWSTYLRDSWQLLANLTLNVGLRYEEQRLRFAETLQGTIDPRSGLPRGDNAMVLRNMWAPRLGLIYDWTKEGRSKIYGSWGRFYESIPMDINDRSFGGEAFLRQRYSPAQCGAAVDAIGGPDPLACPLADETPQNGQTLFGAGTLVAPGIRAQYLDEMLVGIEYEVLNDLTVGLSVQHRRLGRILEDVSVDNAATYIIANPGELDEDQESELEESIAAAEAAGDGATAERLRGQLEQYRGIRLFDKPRRDYHAMALTAIARVTRDWLADFSYTYSRLRGNYPGLFSADNGQVDPNISSQFDLLELLANRDGPLPADRPHYVKLATYYTVGLGRIGELIPGVRFRALSGTPVDALARHYLYGPNESFLLPRGAIGRTGFDTSIDVQLKYRRELGRLMQLEVFTDVFNLLNRQSVALFDEAYTYEAANPVVGGEYEDLLWVKRQSPSGAELSRPIGRNPNFGNPAARYAPLYVRFGARLSF